MMVSADRQIIIETNRSLRNIKTELESLLEKGVIDEAIFDDIHAVLPQESPLSGPLRTATAASHSNNSTPSLAFEPPTQALQNLSVGAAGARAGATSTSPAPPLYEDTPPPRLPARNNAKPVIAHARALYPYAASDARDVSFEKDEKIVIHERLNQDWWLGQNLRTGQEGIFPCSYVFEEPDQKAGPTSAGFYPHQPQYGGYPAPPPAQQNPYNAHAPPMAVAEGGQPAEGGGGDRNVGQYGKKFGKKLGNAAIFGAGATIGGNIEQYFLSFEAQGRW